MVPDGDFERRIQALLDGHPLNAAPDRGQSPELADPLFVIDAIARASRTAIFGREDSPDPSVSRQWGHLEIRSEIGRGASGTVYRAWDSRLAREVALKLLPSDTGAGVDALEEGRLLARLNHPHIVRVFGADTYDGIAGVWMELLEGDTLDTVRARDGAAGVEEVLLIGIDLARATSAVHGAGLLHRDIKGRNILREWGGRVVLMDLGAGRSAAPGNGGSDGTGTPLYMAPEIIAGGPATIQSDIYSLGVVLFRLLAGVFPVAADDLTSLRDAHARGSRTALSVLRPDVGNAAGAVVERACNPVPGSRYQSAAEFEVALVEALADTLSARMPIRSRVARLRADWGRTAAVAVSIAAVLSMALATTWNTNPVRAGRRAFGLVVPPRSPLYLTMNGGLGVLRATDFQVMAQNPATASAIAVSDDLGVRTMASMPPWPSGAAFDLDGRPLPAPRMAADGLCCFSDGTTDGAANYAVRMDSVLTNPIGSRRLEPPALYRFTRDWDHPEQLFALAPAGVYVGVGYSARTRSFWISRRYMGSATIEEWSRDGRHLSTPISQTDSLLTGVAIDPLDDTVWAIRPQPSAVLRLENFEQSGRYLASLELPRPRVLLGAGGAEFPWRRP
jgi:hypothetical protein